LADSKKIIPFILKWEGGLSKDPADSASKYPAPCPYNGVHGYHTNKGITYQTFESLAKKLGYDPSCNNFYTMPVDIFNKIYRQGYWNPFYLDDYKSQAIADMIVSWAWASGVGGSYKQLAKFITKETGVTLPKTYSTAGAKILRDEFNKLSEKKESTTYQKLSAAYQNFYKSLNQPKFIKGWLNRLADLITYSTGNIAEVISNNKGATGVGLLLISGTAVAIWQLSKKYQG